MKSSLHITLPYVTLLCDQKETYFLQGMDRSCGHAHHVYSTCGIFMDLNVRLPHLNYENYNDFNKI